MFKTTYFIPIATILILFGNYAVGKSMKHISSPRTGRKLPKGFYMRKILNLGKGYDLKEVARASVAGGKHKRKFQETYNDIPIYGATLVAGDDDKRFNEDVYGDILDDVEEELGDVTPRLRPQNAIDVCKTFHGDVGVDAMDGNSKLLILPGSEGFKTRLVYKVSYVLMSSAAVKRPICLIDAKSGLLIKTGEGISTSFNNRHNVTAIGGNAKIGTHFSNLDVVSDSSNPTSCMLKNELVETYHMHNDWAWFLPPTGQPYQFDCAMAANDPGQDETNSAKSPVNDLHYYGTETIKTLQLYMDEIPLSLPVKLFAHFNLWYENAFWYNGRAYFGNGLYTYYPLSSSLNIVAHEIAHGITEATSELSYENESGSISESFADMVGEAVEHFVTGTNDFKVGYAAKKDSTSSLRYMFDPTRDQLSIDHVDSYTSQTGVHYGSGIYNKVFYTLANNWTTPEAFRVFAHAHNMYWGPNTTFVSGACGVIRAAKCDLEKTALDVENSFGQVGITCPETITCS